MEVLFIMLTPKGALSSLVTKGFQPCRIADAGQATNHTCWMESLDADTGTPVRSINENLAKRTQVMTP